MTVSSHQKDNVKHDDGMTTSSCTRDTAGGGRGAFSTAYGDVPLTILQKRHTSNRHRNDDNSHYQHDHNHNNTEKGRQSSSKKEGTSL